PLALRTRRDGDRMRPRGGRGSRKLADLLIDAKVPRGTRDELPVLATREGVVLFVPGLRPSEIARPTAATKRFVHVAPLSRRRAAQKRDEKPI
ncbi:MAG: tilS, partial [Myxococcales bacterium]|nr:tilS [Myxococcales bacterium]